MSEKSKSKPIYKYVDFDLPFVLFLKDSLGDKDLENWAKAYGAGEKPLPYSRYAPSSEKPGGLIIGGGFPVYLPPSELAPFYEVKLPDVTVGIRSLKRVNPHRSSVLMGELPGDRTGRASFSSVQVMFDVNAFREEEYTDMELFCNLSIQAINYFIAHYRVITNRPYIGPVTISVIQEFHIYTQFEDGQIHHQEFGRSSGPLRGFGGAISDDLDKALREAIVKSEPPNIEKTLDINIRDFLDLNEWRMAVIETSVIFEAWLSHFVTWIQLTSATTG